MLRIWKTNAFILIDINTTNTSTTPQPDFILVGLGADDDDFDLRTFELFPWSDRAKSLELVCTIPTDFPNDIAAGKIIGKCVNTCCKLSVVIIIIRDNK